MGIIVAQRLDTGGGQRTRFILLMTCLRPEAGRGMPALPVGALLPGRCSRAGRTRCRQFRKKPSAFLVRKQRDRTPNIERPAWNLEPRGVEE